MYSLGCAVELKKMMDANQATQLSSQEFQQKHGIALNVRISFANLVFNTTLKITNQTKETWMMLATEDITKMKKNAMIKARKTFENN